MVDVVANRSKVTPGKTERLRAWFGELAKHEDEVLATLQNENVYTESAFLHEAEDGDYLVYYLEAEDLEAAHEALEEADHEIDEEHRAVLAECLTPVEERESLELLFHAANPDRA